MQLNYKRIGSGSPLIILHGLYGMSDNWLTIAKQLADHFEIFLIDQRNHGASPHSESQTYTDMVDDLKEFFEKHDIEKASILGHSMGGKTAMFFATAHPERISRLIIADISPKSYVADKHAAPQLEMHSKIINAMLSVDFTQVKSRRDVALQMETILPNKRIIQFLLKNLKKNEDNHFSWQLNINAIKNNVNNILEGFDEKKFNESNALTNFPVLFLRGENSDYIQDNDEILIRKIFPYADIVTIFDAGHWLHAEQPQAFHSAIMDFVFN